MAHLDAALVPLASLAILAACSGEVRAATPPASSAVEAPPEPAPRLLVPEPYLTSGFTFFSSDRRLLAGLGGGLGVRLGIGPHVTLHAEGRALSFAGNSFTFAGGASYRYRYQAWEPLVGLQYAGFSGDQVKVITSTQPDLPPPYAWAVQARVALLRFSHERWTAAALVFDMGFGDDAGKRALALSIGFLEVGVRF